MKQNILIATPYMSSHFDAGLFWAKAIQDLYYNVVLWDYRVSPRVPQPDARPDLTLVFKGESIEPESLRHPRWCYWPDKLERTPGIEEKLKKYDKVFTCVTPTPDWMEWLPGGWDPDIHKDLEGAISRTKRLSTYIGTHNSSYKRRMVQGIGPSLVFGNGWDTIGLPATVVRPPMYLNEFTLVANLCEVLICLHHDPETGLNRKFFETMACNFTICDDVPGVREILGDELADEVTFKTPEKARELIDKFCNSPDTDLRNAEFNAISSYTYKELSRRVLSYLPKRSGLLWIG